MKRTAIWNWVFAALLALGTASFALADGHDADGSQGHDGSSASESSGSDQAQPADGNGGQAAQPGDDKGGNPGIGGLSDFRIRRRFMPTPAGVAIDASGHLEIRKQGTRQRFKVEVEAMAANGTTLMVFADSNLAGTVTLQMGEGELELDSEDGDLPEGLDPVTSIKMVTVTDANGVVILQAQI